MSEKTYPYYTKTSGGMVIRKYESISEDNTFKCTTVHIFNYAGKAINEFVSDKADTLLEDEKPATEQEFISAYNAALEHFINRKVA